MRPVAVKWFQEKDRRPKKLTPAQIEKRMKREYFRNMFAGSYQRQTKKFTGEKFEVDKEIDDPQLSGESNIMGIE